MESSSSEKQTTLYSLVVGLAGGTENRQPYLDRFVELYGEPLKSYLVSSMRLDEDLSHDIIQDFLVQKLLDPKNQFAANYLERRAANKQLSFRWYLLRSLRNFAIDKLRLKSREKEASQKLEAYDPQDHTTQVFETEWASNLLDGALRDMKEQCIQEDALDLWTIFEARIVTPAVQGTKPSLGQLAESVGISVRAVQRRLTRSKQKFRAILRQTVADYLPLVGKHGDGLLESELMDLIQTAASLKLLTVSLDDSGTLSLFEFADKTYEEEYSKQDCGELWSSIAAERLEAFALELGDHSIDFAILEQSGLVTVQQLWSFPSPPMSLLQLIKEFAKKTGKQSMHDFDSAYPLPICIALYQLAIATAWQRYDQTRLSRMEPSALLKRLPTVLAYDWLDTDARQLLESWREDLKSL